MKRKSPVRQEKGKGKEHPVKKKKEPGTFLFLAACILVVIPLVLILFYPCLKNGFSNWDDPTYIENNPLIKNFSGENVKRIFTEIYFSNYQPLHLFSYLIEYRFFKLNPYGYHLVSILQHAGVTILVIWLALLLFKQRSIAIITGLLFAVHPLHVESVAWAAERKDMLYATFFFASLIAYIYYLHNGKKTNYFLCFLFFTLAIFSKAMAASLPPVLLLLDFYHERKFRTRVILEKIPFFILAIILGLVSVYASSRGDSINDSSVYSFFDRVLLANANLLLYMIKLVVPFHLCSYYPYPDKINGMLPWFYFLAPAGTALLAGLTVYSLKFNRIIFFCMGFFVITVFLVLQLLPVGPNVFAERYSYIPSATLFMLVAWSLYYFFERDKASGSSRYLAWGAVALYSIWLGSMTPDRCRIWKDPNTFWTDVIHKFDRVPIAYNNRGHFYNKTGKKQEAMDDFNKAISLNPVYDMALFNRGCLNGELGKLPESISDLDKAINLNKKLPEAYKMRGQAYAVTGKPELALSDFKKALELQPDYPDIYFNLGIFYFNAGNKDEACKNFLRAKVLKYDKADEMVAKLCQ